VLTWNRVTQPELVSKRGSLLKHASRGALHRVLLSQAKEERRTGRDDEVAEAGFGVDLRLIYPSLPYLDVVSASQEDFRLPPQVSARTPEELLSRLSLPCL